MSQRRTDGSERCPQCQGDKPVDAPCPRCLLALGLEAAASEATPALPAGVTLGRYVVAGPLGTGGMGEVYRAHDPRLSRDVAIKVLPKALAAQPQALARFEIEARAVAALADANVLALYDYGTEQGVTYAVMELLEGESLRTIVERGPLPATLVADYGAQIASGLAAAHERGIVHRDLKPDNVFVGRRGEVKILDFGLAKTEPPTTAADGGTLRLLTTPGMIVGTIGYMAPEQVRGEAADARADLFSLGSVLYELLSGARAFDGSSVVDVLHAIAYEEPPPIQRLAPAAPSRLVELISRCLRKRADERPQTAREIAAALRELLAGGPASQAAGAPSARRPRLLVLPFENLGPSTRDHLVDGLADEIRGKLTALRDLEVIGRGTSMLLRGTALETRTLAAELAMTHALTATVRWTRGAQGSGATVSAELVEVPATGPPICRWQHTYQGSTSGLATVQAEVAAAVARTLGLAVDSRQQERLAARITGEADAYDAFRRGEQASDGLASSEPPSLRRAIPFYEQAVALDPDFALAWAQLGRASALLYFLGRPDPATAERARAAGERAVALAPEQADGYLARGDYQRWVVKDPAGALPHYLEAWRRAPGAAEPLAAVALAEQGLGRWKQAIDYLRQAERLDPRSLSTFRRLGFGLLWLRRWAEAREVLDQGLLVAPQNVTLHAYRVYVRVGEGSLEDARAAMRACPDAGVRLALVVYYAAYGEPWILDAGDREVLSRLTAQAFDDDAGVWALAQAQARLASGDLAAVPALARRAEVALREQLAAVPADGMRLAMLGVAVALQHRFDEATAVARAAVDAVPVARDGYLGPYLQHQLVKVLLLAGDEEGAMRELEPLLALPYHLSHGWLRIDPTFAALRRHPRFDRLVRRSTAGPPTT